MVVSLALKAYVSSTRLLGHNDATLKMWTVLEPHREIPGRTEEMTACPTPLTWTPGPSSGWAPQNSQGSIMRLCRGRRSRRAVTQAS